MKLRDWSACLFASIAIGLGAVSVAPAQQVCVEEVSGVCLKYKQAPPATPQPATPKKPSPQPAVSAAEKAERALSLGRTDRRRIQSGLRAAGFYNGAIDGLYGQGTRRAIARWQRASGAAPTGYLTGGQAQRLREAGLAAEAEKSRAASTDQPKAEPSPQNAAAFGDLIHNLSCQSIINGYFTQLTFRRGGSIRLVANAQVKAHWSFDNRRFCIMSGGQEVKCAAIDAPLNESSRDQIRRQVRGVC